MLYWAPIYSIHLMTPGGDMPNTNIETKPSTPSKPIWQRLLPLAIIVVALAAFFLLGGPKYVSFSALREHKDALAMFVENNFLTAILGFILVYAVLTAISVPGAWVLSLLGGFLFGVFFGGGAIVIGATLGATGIFLAARYAIGDFLKRKTSGNYMKKFEKGLKENELSYLFILRLIPIFPFFVVNFAPALFDVKVRNYVLSTFFGIMPGSFVYASVGQGLETVLAEGGKESLSGIMLQPKILLPIVGLIALSLLPILYKKFFAKPSTSNAQA